MPFHLTTEPPLGSLMPRTPTGAHRPDPPSLPHAQDVRIITEIEVVYTLFLNQAGVNNASEICANEEEQAQRLMEEAFGRLGIDRTEVGATGAVLDSTGMTGQLQRK